MRRLAGRVDAATFQREFRRGTGEVVSAYDAGRARATIPNPTAPSRASRIRCSTGLTAPLTSAILDHLTRTLNYKPEGRYKLLNGGVNGAWRWGGGRGQPENLSELRQALALDPKLRVLVAHGFTDLVTPYYANQLLLNQLPDFGPSSGSRSRSMAAGTCSIPARPRGRPSATTCGASMTRRCERGDGAPEGD